MTQYGSHSGLIAVQPNWIGAKQISVDIDKDGMIPDSLRQVMSRWSPEDAKNPSSDIPRLLYIIPNAQNPTAAVLTAERKKEIYQVLIEIGRFQSRITE